MKPPKENAMKKLFAVLAVLVASAAYAEPALLPSHAVRDFAMASLGDNVKVTIQAVSFAAATTTWSNNTRTAIITADSGTETMVSAATAGLDLTSIGGVSVILKTSSNATAGGTLQAYLLNAETGTWARAADLDLTATATTNQTWPALWVPVSRGRLYYNPQGIGSVTTTVYLVGQVR